jgi:hypothetical protein
MRIGLNKKATSSETTGEVAFLFPKNLPESSQESFCFSVGTIYPTKNQNVSGDEIQSQLGVCKKSVKKSGRLTNSIKM